MNLVTWFMESLYTFLQILTNVSLIRMTAMIMRLAVIQMDHTFVCVMWVTLEMDLTVQVNKCTDGYFIITSNVVQLDLFI